MPKTREKLIELLGDMIHFSFTRIGKEMIADHLISNGVTFATDNNVGSKWIPVTERLPEKYGKYLCRYVFNESAEYPHIEAISYYPTMTRFQGEGSCGMRVTHWMPLPPAPKGE